MGQQHPRQVDWFEPFVRLLVLWLTFLGASLITKENKHIKIDLMGSLLPDKWLPFRDIISPWDPS